MHFFFQILQPSDENSSGLTTKNLTNVMSKSVI